MPEATASSTPYWMIGLSTSGSISFGCALVAGQEARAEAGGGEDGLADDERHAPDRSRGLGRRREYTMEAEVSMLDPALRPRPHRRGPHRAAATAASTPTRALEELATLETGAAPADPRARGAEARAEHVGRRGRARQAPGARHRRRSRRRTARAAQQIKQLGVAARRDRAPAEPRAARRCRTCRTRACRSGKSAADNVGGAPRRRAARVRLRAAGRTGISAPRSASSTSSARRACPARASRC